MLPWYRRWILLGAILLICVGLFGSAQASVTYNAQDGSRPKDFTIVKKGDTWYWIGIHYFEGSAPPGPASEGLYLATSKDLARWTDQGAVIPVGDAGAWDSYDLWAPSIILVENTYHIFYTGVKTNGNLLVQKIGHATSTDLVNWTKDPNPVFDCSTTTWQYWNINDINGIGSDCRDPYVTRDEVNNRWVMFYNGRSKDPIHDLVLNPAVYWNATPAVIGMATSTNLTSWTDIGFDIASAGAQTESPHVFSHNGTWHLVWTNNCKEVSGNSYVSLPTTTCLKHATSTSITGPFSVYENLPTVGVFDFASEFFTDGTNEYFGRISYSSALFDAVSWPNSTFALTAIPYATVTGSVWFDQDRNGQISPGEHGLDGVRVAGYIDDGDGLLDTSVDTFAGTSTTAYHATLTSLKHGTYKFQNIAAGNRLWIVIPNSNFTSSLAEYVSSTGDLVSWVDVPSTTVITAKNFGFQYADMTPPAGVTSLQAL